MIQLLEGEINVASLRETVDDLNSLIGSLHIEPGKLELIAGLFDENDNLIINPASIIAAIVDNDGKLTSEIAISANQVILDGDVTLTQGLTSMRGEITNLTSSNVTIRSRLTAVEAALGTENGSEEFEKLKDDLEDLTLIVNGKAAFEDLNALAATVGNKTDNSDFQNLVGNLNNLSLVVNGKATVEDLVALSARVDELDVTGTATVSSLLAKGSTDYPRVVINSTDGIQLLTSAIASAININMDGSGSLANGNITWDTNGNVTIRGLLQVGSKVMEILDNVTGNITVDQAPNGITVYVTVTNPNNYAVQASGYFSVDGYQEVWSTTGVLPAMSIGPNMSASSGPISIDANDIPNYSTAASATNKVVTINAWHYVDI